MSIFKFNKIKYNINVCDHYANEVIVHFTKHCDNKCPFCIDKYNKGVSIDKPNVEAICNTLLKYKDYINEVTISGGEPFLYMDELIQLVDFIHLYMKNSKITVMSAIPYICYKELDKFNKILEKIDYLGLTPQHYKEDIADNIRGYKSKYDRQKFYKEIKYKNKIGINLNCCKPYLCTKNEIISAIKHYNKLGYTNIRICEMFDKDDMYVNIEKILGIKLNSPFASGCKTNYSNEIKKFIPDYIGDFYIKRVCFLRTKLLKANIWDMIKMITRCICAKNYFFGVIHEDGTIAPYWI